jgi:hypothetical protein
VSSGGGVLVVFLEKAGAAARKGMFTIVALKKFEKKQKKQSAGHQHSAFSLELLIVDRYQSDCMHKNREAEKFYVLDFAMALCLLRFLLLFRKNDEV